MIACVALREISGSTDRAALEPIRQLLCAELGAAALGEANASRMPVLGFALESWRHPCADIPSFDRLVHELERGGHFVLELSSNRWRADGPAALELLTRYQRLLPLPPATTPVPGITRVLTAHRALHDLFKPLVRADYDHAVDTWRWLLRLEPDASVALQLAALFHDVERLHSEPDRRIEQYAADYVAFKTRHAGGSSRLAYGMLLGLGFDSRLAEHTARLIAAHEQPHDDPELCLLNDADALSFFSLNSWGYLSYFGRAQTRRKVAYTLERMSQTARARVATTRQPAEILAMLDELRPHHTSPARDVTEFADFCARMTRRYAR